MGVCMTSPPESRHTGRVFIVLAFPDPHLWSLAD